MFRGVLNLISVTIQFCRRKQNILWNILFFCRIYINTFWGFQIIMLLRIFLNFIDFNTLPRDVIITLYFYVPHNNSPPCKWELNFAKYFLDGKHYRKTKREIVSYFKYLKRKMQNGGEKRIWWIFLVNVNSCKSNIVEMYLLLLYFI